MLEQSGRQRMLLLFKITAACLTSYLGGCAVVPMPASVARAAAPPVAWVAPLPVPGEAADAAAPQAWWSRFDDPALASLVEQTLAANPGLQQAMARIQQARDLAQQAGSARSPSLQLNGQAQAQRLALAEGVPRQRLAQLNLEAGWEIDLFSRVRLGAEAAGARLQASEFDAQAVRLALAAELARQFIALRACERQAQIAAEDASAAARLAAWSADKQAVGLESAAASTLLRAAAAEGLSRQLAQQAECDVQIKALVALSDQPEPGLRALLAGGHARLPVLSGGGLSVHALPAQTLAQRPDLTAGEAQLRAAWAERGAAEAGRYPQLRLGGSITLAALQLAGGPRAEGSGWSLGPSLTLPLFDAGARRAEAQAAQARFDEAQAGYRAQVLQAVREVEEALVRLDAAGARSQHAQASAAGYMAAAQASQESWRAGLSSAPELEQLRRQALAAQAALVALQAERLSAWIALHKATGGGWQADAAAD